MIHLHNCSTGPSPKHPISRIVLGVSVERNLKLVMVEDSGGGRTGESGRMPLDSNIRHTPPTS